MNARECVGDELIEAVRVLNDVRDRQGSQSIDVSFYQVSAPSQRMYAMDIARLEIYSLQRNEDGIITYETRIEVNADELLLK
jgi:hypothetical protein